MAEENYIASVTVSVTLRSREQGEGVVAEYQVTRMSTGKSGGDGATRAVERAMVNALAAEKALRAGMQNAERRRLK